LGFFDYTDIIKQGNSEQLLLSSDNILFWGIKQAYLSLIY